MNVTQITGNPEDYRQVKIVIGDADKKKIDALPHFEVEGIEDLREFGQLILLLPDSVAEYFRREGRRQLQTEFRLLLNSARA